MKLWFGKRIEAEDSPIGNMVHLYDVDENGNKKFLYYKYTESEDGTPKEELTYENTGDAVQGWQGTPQEGLFLASMETVKSVFNAIKTKDYSELKTDDFKLRKHRFYYAIGDAVFMSIILWVISMIWRGLKEDNPRGTYSGELVAFADAVTNKMANEANLYQSTIGAINTEPMALSYISGLATGLKDAVTGDANFIKYLSRYFGALEPFKGLEY